MDHSVRAVTTMGANASAASAGERHLMYAAQNTGRAPGSATAAGPRRQRRAAVAARTNPANAATLWTARSAPPAVPKPGPPGPAPGAGRRKESAQRCLWGQYADRATRRCAAPPLRAPPAASPAHWSGCTRAAVVRADHARVISATGRAKVAAASTCSSPVNTAWAASCGPGWTPCCPAPMAPCTRSWSGYTASC